MTGCVLTQPALVYSMHGQHAGHLRGSDVPQPSILFTHTTIYSYNQMLTYACTPWLLKSIGEFVVADIWWVFGTRLYAIYAFAALVGTPFCKLKG